MAQPDYYEARLVVTMFGYGATVYHMTVGNEEEVGHVPAVFCGFSRDACIRRATEIAKRHRDGEEDPMVVRLDLEKE